MLSNGATIAVGSENKNQTGLVQVYTLDESESNATWKPRGNHIDGIADGDLFGSSLALSKNGKILASSAPQAKVNNRPNNRPGYVQVFDLNDNNLNWTQRNIDIRGDDEDKSVSVITSSDDGTVLAIGSSGRNNDTQAIRVYWFNTTHWNQRGNTILAENKTHDDNIGSGPSKSLVLSSDGNILAAGAWGKGDKNSGHIRVFKFEGDTWKQRGKAINGTNRDRFGRVVSMSADGSIVASIRRQPFGPGSNKTQSVNVFQFNSTSDDYSPLGRPITFDDDATNVKEAGKKKPVSLAMSSDGKKIAIGVKDASIVRAFIFNNGDWTERGTAIRGKDVEDKYGASLTMSSDGNRLAIGAYNGTNRNVGFALRTG